jgi:hypothetical protein
MQSHALETFNRIQNTIGPESCPAVMLFSSMLALHVLADRSQTHSQSSAEYLDGFLNCLNLMRSVRKVVITDWHPLIRGSDLKSLFDVTQPTQPYNIPPQCRSLENLPRSADLGPTSIAAYDAAIERLQWTYAIADVPNTTHSTIRWLLAWPVQLNDDYSKSLNERRPEALIILAYYGVLLHSYRESWAVGDSGAVVVKAINEQVGGYWVEWMKWPLEMVGAGRETT